MLPVLKLAGMGMKLLLSELLAVQTFAASMMRCRGLCGHVCGAPASKSGQRRATGPCVCISTCSPATARQGYTGTGARA
eukprot:scaffold232803_cov21-Tisochrysis_lutea.AAC.2